MINKQKIRKLAHIAAEGKTIPNDIQQYVLKVLTKQELKIFLSHYKLALDKKRVYVTSAETLSSEIIKNLKEIYKEKQIVETVDKNLGAGIKITEEDMIVDYTFKKYLSDTIEKLKN